MAWMTFEDGHWRSAGWTEAKLRSMAVKPRRWVRIPADHIGSEVVMPPLPPYAKLLAGPDRPDGLVLWELDDRGERKGLPLVVKEFTITIVVPDGEGEPLERMRAYLGPQGDPPDDLDALPVLDWPGLRAELGHEITEGSASRIFYGGRSTPPPRLGVTPEA